MIAVDWSHVKELTTFDGKKVRVESLKTLLKRISKDIVGDESIVRLESTEGVQPRTLIGVY